MLAFADDMVFFADTSAIFNKVILGLKDYFSLNKLTINIKKTKVVLFKKGGFGCAKDRPLLFYDKDVIEYEKEYMYLGVPFVQSGLFEKATKYFSDKGKKAIQPTLNVINRIKTVDINLCNKLFKTLVSSIVLSKMSKN